jgi:UDP-N-acetylmuramoyl-tripeptide--D-alanyl-D-alanine ligase
LGEASVREHGAVIGLLQELELTQVYLIGENFSKYSEIEAFTFFTDVDSCISHLKLNQLKEKQVLIKGSRGIHLEKLLPYL